MKKILFGILFLVSIFCLMAEPLPFTQEDSSYKVINNDRTIQVAFYGSEYLTEYFYKKEVEEAIVESRKPIKLSYPAMISIKVISSNIEYIDPIEWLFIVQDGNKQEIYRKNGEHQNPILSSNGLFGIGKTYEAYHYILLNDKQVDFPLYLQIINSQKVTIDIVIIKK
jgi:hypothetical protein